MLVDLVTGANSTFPPIAPRVASYAGISGLLRGPPSSLTLPYPDQLTGGLTQPAAYWVHWCVFGGRGEDTEV